MVSANYEAYKSVMKQAFRDGEITPEETAILDTLRQSLNISSEEHQQCESEVQKELANGGGPNEASDNSNTSPPPMSNQNPSYDDNIIRPGHNPGEFGSHNENNPSMNPGGDIATTPVGEMERESLPEAEEPQSLEDLLKAGKSSYHTGDFQMAISYFDKALELDSENSEALFFRKRSHSKLMEKGGGSSGGAMAGAGAGVGAMNPAANTAVSGTTVEPPIPASEMRGDPNCSSCNGSGTCRWCKASGGCYWCKGSGQCDKCKGTGVLKGQQCSSCAGSGKCHSCKGTGHCYWCQGDGKCSKCST